MAWLMCNLLYLVSDNCYNTTQLNLIQRFKIESSYSCSMTVLIKITNQIFQKIKIEKNIPSKCLKIFNLKTLYFY